MTLKEKVTDLCKERGISVRELERRAKLKERTIQHWDDSEPSGSKILAVADVLDVPVSELLAVYSSDPDTYRIVYLNKLQRELDKYKNGNKKTATYVGDGANPDSAIWKLQEAIPDLTEQQAEYLLPLVIGLISDQKTQDSQ